MMPLMECFDSQFLFDPSKCMENMHKWFACFLPWWHSYKFASNQIWKRHEQFTRPWQQHLFPGNKWFKTPTTHTGTVGAYLFFRKAWPKVRRLWTFHNNKAVEAKNEVGIVSMQNLRDMMEYFIPVVSLIYFAEF